MEKRREIYTADSRFTVAVADGKPTTVAGYAIIWNALSSDRGGYQVRLMPGSAKFTTPALALRGHNYDDLLASTANGTLRIKPDDTGVHVEIDLPDTTVGRDVATLVKRGDLSGMSFSMVNGPEKSTSKNEGGKQILDVEMFTVDEVTITAIPAFRETTVAASNFHDAIAERHRFQARRLLPL